MAIFLETLEHQQKAIEAIIGAMEGCRDFNESNERDFKYVYANPIIKLKPENVKRHLVNIESLHPKNLDIKMETGTGKTFVYTKMMYELYEKFGLNKFMIFVPSLAIKEGAKNFILADYAKKYFNSFYPGVKIDLSVVNAGSFSGKKGRKTLPSELVDFLEGTRHQHGTIKCLLINDAMITSKSMNDEYDQTLISSVSRPLEALKATRPVVIIDEPHRFKRDSKAYQAIKSLNPQMIVRFGATFPEIKIGKGKNAITRKDYQNLIYDLNSVESFNNDLVKGVDALYPDLKINNDTARYKMKSVTARRLILTRGGRDFEVLVGENLPSEFGNVSYEGGRECLLSTGLELKSGMELYPNTIHASYQEIMISQALDQHFTKERENWLREEAGENAAKIKTLSLFFIDSISSYRQSDGWLKNTFERILRQKLSIAIEKETNFEYKNFLEVSLANIEGCHGGYFAEDASGKTKDEKIQQEVDDILRNKNRLISFKDEKGKWVLRRFLFSKWTLREGWDNPNVFTIAKLRSSGSEISKLQEVGRGLRLPVDETGRRLSGEDFRLSYIIDFSERDFAEKLVGEINENGRLTFSGRISDEIIKELVRSNYGEDEIEVEYKLKRETIIDGNKNILDSIKLQAIFPDSKVVKKNKIRVNPKNQTEKIQLRKNNWEKIKDLWLEVSRRYMIKFEKITDAEILELAKASLTENLRESVVSTQIQSTQKSENVVVLRNSEIDSGAKLEAIPYGIFLRKLSESSNIPPKVWHEAILSFNQNFSKQVFNTESLFNILKHFSRVFEEKFAQKYDYEQLDFVANNSLIRNREFVSEISKKSLGTISDNSISVDERNLWPEILYDSEKPEGEIGKIRPSDKVLIFGKLPRRAIRVPLLTGGTTSPDFVYAFKNDDGKVKLSLFVEAKAGEIRDAEKIAVGGQKSFFAKNHIEWEKVTDSQKVQDLLSDLASD